MGTKKRKKKVIENHKKKSKYISIKLNDYKKKNNKSLGFKNLINKTEKCKSKATYETTPKYYSLRSHL